MIFIILAILAIVLYIKDYKISALFIFFFFATTGFNLVPHEIVDVGVPLTKSADYAFFILLIIILIDSIFVKKYLRFDTFGTLLLIFGIYMLLSIAHSKTSVGLSFSEILRTCRYLFFWMAYFVLRNLTKEQLQSLFKLLFIVAVITSALYLLQIVIGKHILVETVCYQHTFLGISTWRFYNQPEMIHFFAIVGIFCNPYSGIAKRVTNTILIMALLGAFHRSVLGCFCITLIVGYVVNLPRLKKIRIATVAGVLVFIATVFIGPKFIDSRTFRDLSTVAAGDIANVEIDITELHDATFTFRIAHLLERNEYILENKKSMLWGAGLIPEDSKKVDTMFDFKIGLIEELTGNTIQLDSSDISYSVMVLRLGYLGSFLNLLLFIYPMIFFYRHKDNKYGFASFLYFVFAFGISFFVDNLLYPITFLLPMITYNILKKEKEENMSISTKP